MEFSMNYEEEGMLTIISVLVVCGVIALLFMLLGGR